MLICFKNCLYFLTLSFGHHICVCHFIISSCRFQDHKLPMNFLQDAPERTFGSLFRFIGAVPWRRRVDVGSTGSGRRFLRFGSFGFFVFCCNFLVELFGTKSDDEIVASFEEKLIELFSIRNVRTSLARCMMSSGKTIACNKYSMIRGINITQTHWWI